MHNITANHKQNIEISVLYIHHAGTFGGASRSLIELIKAFPKGSIKAHLITQKGNVEEFFNNEQVKVKSTIGLSQFDNTRYGYYRGIRWLILIREFWYFYFTIKSLINSKKEWKNIDLVHVNEITNIAAIILAKIILDKPVIVHVRSIQQNHRAHLRYSIVKHVLKRYADFIVAIDKTVMKSLPNKLPVQIIHNGCTNIKSENVKSKPGVKNALTKLFKAPEGYLKIAMVGSLLVYKGVFEFINAAKICIEKGYKIVFYLIGARPHYQASIKNTILRKLKFAHYIESEINQFIIKQNLTEKIKIFEFTININTIYENIDILCFPSHLNAVGRPVIEAAFYKVPSIVAITDPFDDTMIDGETGFCVPPKNYRAIADAIKYFYSNPNEIKRMGDAAYQLALKNFDVNKNAEKMLRIYKNCL